MKKFIRRTILFLILLVILGAVAIHFFLDAAIKKGVETIGPELAKVDIKLDSVNLFLLSGSGSVSGFVVGNPEGYKTPWAINVGEASLAIQPSSLLSDKIVIRTVNVEAPQITFETDMRHNNLNKIISNIDEATGGGQQAGSKPAENKPAGSASGKKLEVDDFIIRGGKVNVSVTTLGGKSATVKLPEIHLKDLGRGPEGITAAELSKRVLVAIEENAAQVATGAIADLEKGMVYIGKDASSNAVEKVSKGLGDLFKKK